MSAERLAQYAHAEVAAGHTLVGPHKDDLKVLFDFDGNWEDIATYGSRGQQRMAVLWLKLCELRFLETELVQKPILLLDDILSELDDCSKDLVLALINEHQTIITSTEARVEEIIKKQTSNLQVVKIGE
jgi:DNA replication and repair protein RecF